MLRTIKDVAINYLPLKARRWLYASLNPEEFAQLQLMKLRSTDEYSCLPFLESKCLFVHIPKTGGLSVNNALFGRNTGGHLTMDKYQMIFDQFELKNLFKFTIVRNPWDRLFSAYSYLKDGGTTDHDKVWSHRNLSKFRDFEEFVLNWVNTKNVISWIHFVPQYRFIMTPITHKFQVDFIGKFESLDDDFQTVCKQIGRSEIKLPHLNQSNTNDYRSQYNQKMRDVVAKVYIRDIQFFGYAF